MKERICVFCGASDGVPDVYVQAAYRLGIQLAEAKIGLVYGGGSAGLMGTIANGVLNHGGEVIGVIPEALQARERKHTELSKLYIVNTMHERKAKMAELANGFVALPGGFGTYEELFEVITWAQLGIHAKPIILFNVSGYFDPLNNLIQHAVAEGFIRLNDPQLLNTVSEVEAVIPAFRNFKANPNRPKWLNLDQS